MNPINPNVLAIAKKVGYAYGWDFEAALRTSKVSIRDLATWLQVTQRRVRHVRDLGVTRFPFLIGLDYFMAVQSILKFRKLAGELRRGV